MIIYDGRPPFEIPTQEDELISFIKQLPSGNDFVLDCRQLDHDVPFIDQLLKISIVNQKNRLLDLIIKYGSKPISHSIFYHLRRKSHNGRIPHSYPSMICPIALAARVNNSYAFSTLLEIIPYNSSLSRGFIKTGVSGHVEHLKLYLKYHPNLLTVAGNACFLQAIYSGSLDTMKFLMGLGISSGQKLSLKDTAYCFSNPQHPIHFGISECNETNDPEPLELLLTDPLLFKYNSKTLCLLEMDLDLKSSTPAMTLIRRVIQGRLLVEYNNRLNPSTNAPPTMTHNEYDAFMSLIRMPLSYIPYFKQYLDKHYQRVEFRRKHIGWRDKAQAVLEPLESKLGDTKMIKQSIVPFLDYPLNAFVANVLALKKRTIRS